jgi:hypothetical protein
MPHDEDERTPTPALSGGEWVAVLLDDDDDDPIAPDDEGPWIVAYIVLRPGHPARCLDVVVPSRRTEERARRLAERLNALAARHTSSPRPFVDPERS